HGLDDSNDHYSTARDMALLTAYALRNPVFKKIVSTKVKTIPNQGEEWDRRLLNKNKMLRMYQGADGVKTGYTKLAKRCLASSATRNGQQLAIVVLNAPDDWDDSATWMNYGFTHFPKMELLKTKQAVQEKKDGGKEKTLYTTRSFSYPLRPEEKGNIKMDVKTVDDNPMMEVKLGDQVIGRIPLEATKKTKETIQPTLANRVKNQWDAFWRSWLGVLSDG
ncbi:MAG TPA: D-alanyl-D-alanine carboxypeptidase, partial [Paenibacillaceae bacterium]|nr:D-alanyl-D-alanine carboxypeptidase [Paenibacillaceae bacterium]